MSHKSVALILWYWMVNHQTLRSLWLFVYSWLVCSIRSSHWHSMTYQGTSIMSFINVHHTFKKKTEGDCQWPLACVVKPLSGELKGFRQSWTLRFSPQPNPRGVIQLLHLKKLWRLGELQKFFQLVEKQHLTLDTASSCGHDAMMKPLVPKWG